MRTPTESGRLHDWARRDETLDPGARAAQLTRFVTWALGVEAMLLVALGVSGLGRAAPGGRAATSGPPPVSELLGFRPSAAHSALLLVTGLLALGALWLPSWRRGFAAVQAVGYLLIASAGLVLAATTPAGSAWHLNPADHVLHGVLCLLGVALLLLCRATRRSRHDAGSPATARPASPTPEPPASTDPR
jgi:hypothetical protein